MKNTFLSFLLLATLLFSASTYAQPVVGAVTKKLPKVNVGLKLGANFESLSGNEWQKTYQPGVVFGAFARLYKGHWGVDLEALVNTAKYSPVNSFSTGTFNAVYLDVPVLLEYKIVPRIWLQVGPQFSSIMSLTNSAVNDAKDYFKSSDVSGIIGLQAILPMHFVVGVRYVLGFTSINNISLPGAGDAWYNRTIQVHVGFRFL